MKDRGTMTGMVHRSQKCGERSQLSGDSSVCSRCANVSDTCGSSVLQMIKYETDTPKHLIAMANCR